MLILNIVILQMHITLADATYCSTVYSQLADSVRVSAIITTPNDVNENSRCLGLVQWLITGS